MTQLDAIRALTRAEGSFATLQLYCVAEYDTSTLQRAQAAGGSVTIRGDDVPERFQHDWRVWWRKPDCWRDDIIWQTGHSAVSIVCGDESTTRLSALADLRPFHIRPRLADRLAQMPLAYPLELTKGWSLTTIGEGEQAGRGTLRVRAVRGPHAGQFGLWSYVNEYVVDVDIERGILLRCVAILAAAEVSALTVQSVHFDAAISDAIFRAV